MEMKQGSIKELETGLTTTDPHNRIVSFSVITLHISSSSHDTNIWILIKLLLPITND